MAAIGGKRTAEKPADPHRRRARLPRRFSVDCDWAAGAVQESRGGSRMKRAGRYGLEFGLIAAVILIMILGFWDIYFGADADAQPHHHLHITTVFIWIGLLLTQLTLMARGSYQMHSKVGLAVLVGGPLLVATTAMLSVHSAHKGLVSGEGDFLIVQ